MRGHAHSAVAVGLLVPLHGFVNGTVDEAVETFAVLFRVGPDGVLAPLRHDKIIYLLTAFCCALLAGDIVTTSFSPIKYLKEV